MSKTTVQNKLVERWRDFGSELPSSSPFGNTADAHADFRGISLSKHGRLQGRQLHNCDFSFSDFSGLLLERCSFERCIFTATRFDNSADHQNVFLDCDFTQSSFRSSGIGYKSSRYMRSRFDGCSFSKAVFANAIFRDVVFVNNKMVGLDFNASGFWNCKFTGSLKDVWFRGRYPHATLEKTLGTRVFDFIRQHYSL